MHYILSDKYAEALQPVFKHYINSETMEPTPRINNVILV